MKITDFNFLPAAYDRIKYIHNDTLTITEAGMYVFKNVPTNGIGYFLPILLISLDGETWYDASYPPEDDSGTILARGDLLLYGDRINISGTRNTAGTLYIRVMGIEL